MRELNSTEINAVNGGFTDSLASSLEGALYGFGDGLVSGIAIGGTATASGGLGFGVIAQAAGAVIGAVVGGVYGTVAGFLYGKDEVKALCQSYRETIN
ncbi:MULTISPECIES: hypothetical protein [Enterobacterales]|uniref:DUF5862 family protein n=1 Tax=Enterobacterales TaxID=91347 RepID=UPI002EDA0B28